MSDLRIVVNDQGRAEIRTANGLDIYAGVGTVPAIRIDPEPRPTPDEPPEPDEE